MASSASSFAASGPYSGDEGTSDVPVVAFSICVTEGRLLADIIWTNLCIIVVEGFNIVVGISARANASLSKRIPHWASMISRTIHRNETFPNVRNWSEGVAPPPTSGKFVLALHLCGQKKNGYIYHYDILRTRLLERLSLPPKTPGHHSQCRMLFLTDTSLQIRDLLWQTQDLVHFDAMY